MKTILVSAYAVNPYKGSEDGMGWNMILQIARFQCVIAITRKNNRPAIEKFLEENHLEHAVNIRFEYFDLPYYLRFWKKGSRGALVYFYLWQLGLALWAKKQNWKFDIAHNLNFHNDWTPSFLWLLGKPLAWGPIGHHPRIPKQFAEPYGRKAIWKDRFTWWVKRSFWKWSFFLRLTAKKARKIFVMNDSVVNILNLDPDKTVKLPSVGSEKAESLPLRKDKTFQVLSIGRFVPLKGFDITLCAFADFYTKLPVDDQAYAHLVIVGKGPFEDRLKRLAGTLGIAHAVTFIDWIERERLFQIYRKSRVFLFPSHEGAGMVVSEALSFGLPVLCFDNCGPGEFVDQTCGFKVPYQEYSKAVQQFAAHLGHLFCDRSLLKDLSVNAVKKHEDHFQWNVKGTVFKKAYDSMVASVPAEVIEHNELSML